jgi:arachidonate 15-lipoxygenase
MTQPTLPQHDSPAQQAQRAFDLSLARTEYNYMLSYLDAVPISADLPDAEKFSLDYEAKVLAVFARLAENFKSAVMRLLERELKGDLPTDALAAVRTAYEKLKTDFSLLHPLRDIEEFHAFVEALAKLPKALEGLLQLPKDLEKMALGLEQVFGDFLKNGPTAFLKSTLFDMLRAEHGRDYLQAQTTQDYADLIGSLPQPLMLRIEPQAWMPQDGLKPCEQDWYFGWQQIAGYNTTQLRGVVEQAGDAAQALLLSELLRKMPLSDALLAQSLNEPGLTLLQAAREHRLYVCDYAQFVGAKADALHGQQRYLATPIALFCWNPKPGPGYPAQGVLQPIAIQLDQQHDPETAPIFTPGDRAGANDPSGMKWRLAKHICNVMQAIQHESVAHLGDCHLIVEPIVVAAHRQLHANHPLLKLLLPHFRFTININDSAIHSLIAPGGVVATNVGPAIEDSLRLVSEAHRAWRWDDAKPERNFQLRGVDKLPVFPYRDDARLLWSATQAYVSAYLRTYYRSSLDVQQDYELQAWVKELTTPGRCGFQGLNGLASDGTLQSLDYLAEMVTQILFTAGPQHAAVNYAQFELMSYMPAVAGTLYAPPPTRSQQVATAEDCLPWFPPLDVGLYTLSFEYLLTGVQYDRYGHYGDDQRLPYFSDPRVQEPVADFHEALALAEIEIRRRNRARPVPYPFLLPSLIPNSVSI